MTNRAEIAANWATRGFSCELWTDSPGQCWEDFVHATATSALRCPSAGRQNSAALRLQIGLSSWILRIGCRQMHRGRDASSGTTIPAALHKTLTPDLVQR